MSNQKATPEWMSLPEKEQIEYFKAHPQLGKTDDAQPPQPAKKRSPKERAVYNNRAIYIVGRLLSEFVIVVDVDDPVTFENVILGVQTVATALGEIDDMGL